MLADPTQPARSLDDLAAPLRAFIARRVAADHVDDVLQDALLKAHQNASQVQDAGRFSAWVYRVGRSAVADHHRRNARRPKAAGVEPEPAFDDNSDGAEEAAFRQALGVGLSLAIDSLPADYAQALRLVELQGLSQAAAAASLGLPRSSLRSRVQRGRAMLRKRLQQQCELHFDARDRLVGCTPRATCCSDP